MGTCTSAQHKKKNTQINCFTGNMKNLYLFTWILISLSIIWRWLCKCMQSNEHWFEMGKMYDFVSMWLWRCVTENLIWKKLKIDIWYSHKYIFCAQNTSIESKMDECNIYFICYSSLSFSFRFNSKHHKMVFSVHRMFVLSNWKTMNNKRLTNDNFLYYIIIGCLHLGLCRVWCVCVCT